MSKVPQGLTKIFPNLKLIQITISNLKSIKRNDFIEYCNINGLYISYTEVDHLPGDLFFHMRKLKWIAFNCNKIKTIEPNLLDKLNDLCYVNLTENPCIDKCYDKNEFNGPALEEFKNEIRKMSHNTSYQEVKITSDKPVEGIEVWIDIKNVICNEKFIDFVVKVGDEEFKVHKLLLAARSPVFAQMIENNIDAECLNLVDIPTDIFREILNFIYTDELPKSDQINFTHLFAAAGRLKIEKLKQFAAGKLLDKINDENALEVLTLANKYENDILRQKSFEEFKKLLNDIEISDDLAFQPDKLRNIMEIKKERDEMMKMIELKFQKALLQFSVYEIKCIAIV